jgi:hypothetical protein
MHHRRGVRLNARRKCELIVHLLHVRNYGIQYAVLRSRRIGSFGRLAALAAAEKEHC